MTCMSSVGIIKSKKKTMKKVYVKPAVVVEDFMVELAFLVGSNNNESNVPGEEGEGDVFGANDRRGSWGDFWN